MEESYINERNIINPYHTVFAGGKNSYKKNIESPNGSDKVDYPPENIKTIADLNNARYFDEDELKNLFVSHSDLESSTVNSAEIDELMKSIYLTNDKNKNDNKFSNNYHNKNTKNKSIKTHKNEIIFNLTYLNKKSNESKNKSMILLEFNKLKQYKKSNKYKNIKNFCYYANKLEIIEGKYDFNSERGNNKCLSLIKQIELLISNYHIKKNSREYRQKYMKSYFQIFYNNDPDFLTNFLQLAENGISYYNFNDNEYKFTEDAIKKRENLISSFDSLIEVLQKSFDDLISGSFMDNSEIKNIDNNIKKSLENFDKYYTEFEEQFSKEFLSMEKKAKSLFYDIINIESEMTNYENKYIKGKNNYKIISLNDKEYNKIREKFMKAINKLYLFVNGDVDEWNYLEIDVLDQADKILCTVTEIQSLVLRNLSKEVIDIVNTFRNVFKEDVVYDLDPEIRNNYELIDLLYDMERIWEKGKKYLRDYKKLLNFNKIVNVIIEKYKEHNFRNLFEKKDPVIIINIPSILILDAIDRHSNEIIEEYIPDLKNNELFNNLKKKIKKVYQEIGDKFLAYNLLERLILFQNIDNNDYYNTSYEKIKEILTGNEINEFIRDIKSLGLTLQRTNPMNWNEFLELAMKIGKEN